MLLLPCCLEHSFLNLDKFEIGHAFAVLSHGGQYMLMAAALITATCRGLPSNFSFCCNTGHNFNRVWVITGGCLLWGVMTGGFSLCTVLWQVKLLNTASQTQHCTSGVAYSMTLPPTCTPPVSAARLQCAPGSDVTSTLG